MARDWPASPVPRYHRAVFLDRDGTINVDTHFPHQVASLQLIPEALHGISMLAELALDVIVVSNQAGIALGVFTQEDMSRFNCGLRTHIERAHGRIDAFYFCPHLEPKHLPPGTAACICAKPAPGMLLEAAQDFELDLTKSFLIGDRASDIAAGASVGCTTVLVETGCAGRDGNNSVYPTHIASNLHEAALVIRSYLHR